MLPSFIVVRVKGGFFICGKVEKTIGTTEYFKDKFRLRESLESSRLWEKTFVVGSYLIEGAERKEARGT